MNKVGSLAQQAFALTQGFTDQVELSMLEIAQAAVNDARRAAGNAGSEIVLLDQQRTLARACALTRHSNAVDASTDDHDVKVLAVQ